MSFNLPTGQAATIFSGVSGIVGGIGQFASGAQESNLGDRNAEIYDQRAQAQRESQELTESQKRKLIKSRIGQQVSQTGSSGFRFGGDPVTIMTESLANAEMDLMIDKYNSEVSARGFESQSDLEKYEARQRSAKMSVNSAGTFFSTAAKLFTSQSGDKLGD